MTQVHSSPQNTHGAGWLYKLMWLIQSLSVAFLLFITVWLIISFPVWWSSAPRISLPLFVDLNPSGEMISVTPENTKILSFSPGEFKGELDIKFENAWAQWIYIVIIGLQNIVALMIIRELRQIVGSIHKGLAFSHENARRLRMLGLLIFCMAVCDSVLVAGFCRWAVGSFTSSGGGLGASYFLGVFDKENVITIWFLFVLSEVFRQGSKMSEEQSLTI